MFSKFRKGKKRGEKEQQLSRSLDDLLYDKNKDGHGDEITSEVEWPELASVKKVSPVVMCILPPFSMDFVCSALLSVGATPLITDSKWEDLVLHKPQTSGTNRSSPCRCAGRGEGPQEQQSCGGGRQCPS